MTPTDPDTRRKALGYLREGRVTVLRAALPEGGKVPVGVRAHVHSHQGRRQVKLRLGVWSCDCDTERCPHVAAVQLVTGHPSHARKDGR